MPFPGTPLQVPDFNKQEVEGIAVDAVKKEIASGDIPTGTKLYKHVLTLDKALLDGTSVLTIFSNEKNKFDDTTDFSDKFALISHPYVKALIGLGCVYNESSSSSGFSYIYQNYSSYPKLAFYKKSNILADEPTTSSAISITSDTVTEL